MPYGLHLSRRELRRMARVRIEDGRLPRVLTRMFRPGYGTDEMCQLCDQPIDTYRIEYQVTDPRDGYPLAFHLMCYRLWQLECTGVGAASTLGSMHRRLR